MVLLCYYGYISSEPNFCLLKNIDGLTIGLVQVKINNLFTFFIMVQGINSEV